MGCNCRSKIYRKGCDHTKALSLYRDVNKIINLKNRKISSEDAYEAMNRLLTEIPKIPTASLHIAEFLSEVKQIKDHGQSVAPPNLGEAEWIQQSDQGQASSSSNRQEEQVEHIPLTRDAIKALNDGQVNVNKKVKNANREKSNIRWRRIFDTITDILDNNSNKRSYTDDVRKLKDLMTEDKATAPMRSLYANLASHFPDL